MASLILSTYLQEFQNVLHSAKRELSALYFGLLGKDLDDEFEDEDDDENIMRPDEDEVLGADELIGEDDFDMDEEIDDEDLDEDEIDAEELDDDIDDLGVEDEDEDEDIDEDEDFV